MSNEVQEKIEEATQSTTKQLTGKENIKSEVLTVADKTSSNSSLKVLSKDELATLDYNDFSTPGRMLALAEVLVKGEMCPLKKPADVVIALITGRSLGVPFIQAISQIYPINGKPSLGTHIQKALALKHGILYKRIRHYESYFEFVGKDKDGKPETTTKIVSGKEVKVPVVVSTGFLNEQPKDTFKREIDRVTEYELKREIRLPSGRWEIIIQTGSFSLSEAKQAGLDGKDNWKNYPKDMLDARAFDRAMSEIADDIKQGLKSPEILSGGDIQEAVIVD